MSKWKRVKLKDISAVITKGTTPSNIGASFAESGIPYIKSEYLTFSDKYIVPTEPCFISAETHEKLKRSQLCSQDILLSMAGAYLGKSAILRDEDVPANTNQAVALIRIDSNRACPDYVYYFLNQKQLIAFMNQLPNQSAQPNINLAQIGSLEVGLPEIEAQKRTAGILSSYDKLIENNRRQIALLEEAAQRLYKEWFVDLRFPGYETVSIHDGLPEGWEVVPAESYCDISIGKTPPRKEPQWYRNGTVKWASVADLGTCSAFIGETKELLNGDAVEQLSVKVVPADTILLSFKMTIGRVAIASEPMATNEAIAHFKYPDIAMREYLYEYLCIFEYSKLGSTSSISTAINSKIVKRMPLVLPTTEVIRAFHAITAPMFDAIGTAERRIAAAREARDRLLPKLVSGEIEVG